jgi:chromosomal replication initiation ATPase DnaA
VIHDRVESGPHVDPHLVELQHGLRSELIDELGRNRWRLWFRDTEVVRVGSECVTIAVPTEVHRAWIEYTYANELHRACARVLGEGVAVRLEVSARQGEKRALREQLPTRPDEWERRLAEKRRPPTFESFRPHAQDRWTVLLLRSLVHGGTAGSPAPTVYVYGDPGSGKSHLLSALHGAIEAQAPGECLLLTTKRFTSLFVATVRSGSVGARRAFEADLTSRRLVLLDGVDALEGRPATQAEVVRLLERAPAGGPRLVLAGRRHPRELTGLLPTLASRLLGGPVVRLGNADRALQGEIVASRAAALGRTPPPDVVDGILDRTGSTRSAVQWAERWAVASDLLGAPLEARWLGEVAPSVTTATREEVVRRAKAAVARHFSMDAALLDRPTKVRTAALPRRIAMYLVYRATAMSLGKLGRAFGWRSHSSVSRALQQVRAQRDGDAELEQLIDGLLARL